MRAGLDHDDPIGSVPHELLMLSPETASVVAYWYMRLDVPSAYALGLLTGIPDRTIDRWEQGLSKMPMWATRLMSLMLTLADHGLGGEIERWGRRTVSAKELAAWADQWPFRYMAAQQLGIHPTKLSRMLTGRRRIPAYIARMLDLDTKLRQRGLPGIYLPTISAHPSPWGR